MSGTLTKRDAIAAFRDQDPHGSLTVDRAAELASPWDVSDVIQDWRSSREERYPDQRWDAIPTTLTMTIIVGRGTDEKPMSCDEYYFGSSARAIGGHQKCERGEYKGNLSLLERDAEMEMTHGLRSPAQNGTEPCPECGRTCIYRREGSEETECANCGTEVALA